MPRRFKVTLDPANSSTDHYKSGATGASIALDETDSGDSLARQIIVLNNDARDDQAITITIVGTDADGRPQTEVIDGPDASTTTASTKYYLTVTSITPVSTIGSNTWDIGYTDEFVSKTYPLNHWSDVAAPILAEETGTVVFTAELTFDPPNNPNEFTWTDQNSPTWIASTNISGATATTFTTLDVGAYAMRMKVTAYTDTGELAFWISQTESK